MYGNPYYNQYPRYSMNGNVPQQMPTQPSYIPPITQPISQSSLLGKMVDSIESAKNMEYPLDGSISYFALTDGSAIVTKQLQTDGTSKTIIYKPVQENEVKAPTYATMEDIDKKFAEIDLSEVDDIKEELREIRKQLKEIKKGKGE